MTHRYTLIESLHFPVQVDGKTLVVTMQRCDSLRSPSRRSEFAVLHNGRTVRREIFTHQVDLVDVDAAFTEAKAKHAGELLTEDQARDLIGEQTGSRPMQQACLRQLCGALVPLGDYRCGEGHSQGQIGSGSISGVMRHPVGILKNAGDK